jgi:inner membrane protein
VNEVDNLCHSLAGAALAEAGLKQRTRFGTAALVVASNLPDVDVLVFLGDTPSVAFRRGWTHGVLAQALLPVLLTACFVLVDKWRPDGRPAPLRLGIGSMLFLCHAGVLAHVAMDWLNSYGVRLLMPFSNRWFYGDAVFIIDPWLWLTFAAGMVVARRARRPAPARIALIIATTYIAAMVVSARAARQTVLETWTAQRGRAPAALMVGPAPINPLRKIVIADDGVSYDRGRFTWPRGHLQLDPQRTPKHDAEPATVAARADPEFQAILKWSRFPVYALAPADRGTRVTISDMRFGADLFSASKVVPVR